MMRSEDQPSVAVELELVLGADPIRGTIRRVGHAQAGFTGWLELLGTLEAIRGQQPARPQTRPPRPRQPADRP